MKDNALKFLFKPLFFICSLLAGSLLVLYIEKLKPSHLGSFQDIFKKEVIIKKQADYPLRQPSGELSPAERRYAQIAWNYFRNNTGNAQGLAASFDGTGIMTIQDQANYFFALSAALETGVITKTEFHNRLMKAINSLSSLPLVEDGLPNTLYMISRLRMVNEKGEQIESEKGTWNAVHISRFITACNQISTRYPQYQKSLRKITRRWNINAMLDHGYLFSKTDKGRIQEGTLGFEEYSAKGLIIAGFDALEAISYTDFIRFIPVYNVEIGVDTRGEKDNPLSNVLHSEPFILDGLEYGWDMNSRELAYRIFKVQKKHFKKTSRVTATANEPVNVEGDCVFNCVFAHENLWQTLNERGEEQDDLSSLSTKAAFGWYALFDDDYSTTLLNSVSSLYDEQKGWYAGRFYKTGEVNKVVSAYTNAVVLEALCYKKSGRLMQP